jgi:hypothetical protein
VSTTSDAFVAEYVLPLNHPAHERSLMAWLLELLPPGARTLPAIYRHKDIALVMAYRHTQGQLHALRSTYADFRRLFAGVHPPEVVASGLGACEKLGRELTEISQALERLMEAHGVDVDLARRAQM